jgi:hypothetical protein
MPTSSSTTSIVLLLIIQPKSGSWTGWSAQFFRCRVRCNDAKCDHAGQSSAFRRKVRPEVGCSAPMYHGRGRASPPLPNPRFGRPLGRRSGARPRRTKRCPSKGRCDPVAGCGRPTYHKRGRASPPLPDPRFAGALERRSGAPFHRKELQRSDVPQKMCNPPRNELIKKVKIKSRKMLL